MKHQSKSYKVQVENIKSFIHTKAGISSSWLYTREKTYSLSLYKKFATLDDHVDHLPIQPNRKAHGKFLSDIKCTILEAVMSTSHLQAN